jgi:rod shape-determining protein MreD
MKWRRRLKTLAVFAALVILNYTVRPVLGWRVSMDFLVIALLLMAVRLRPGSAALLGFVTGLMADSLAPTSFGAGALAMTAIGFGASWLKAAFFADNVVLHATYFFLGKWAYDVVHVVAERRAGVTEVAAQLLVWSPLSALLTAGTGVLIMLVFRASLEPQTA